MKTGLALLAAVFLGIGGLAHAAPASSDLLSPDLHQTWPQGNLRGWSFRLDPDGKSFTAVVTYSNELVADRVNPQQQEDFFFRFPDAVYDPKRGGFVWRQPRGNLSVVVAWRSSSGASTVLAKRAVVLLFNNGGRLAAALRVAPSGVRFPASLIEIRRAAPWTIQGLFEN